MLQSTTIESKIHEFRGHNGLLDADLAELYETETKRLKEAVRRNIDRFPTDFMFELTGNEFATLRTQFASSKSQSTRYLPFAFTEQGVAMLASVLNSPKAIQVNISIVRTFVKLRQYALSHQGLTDQLKQLEGKYDRQFADVYEALNYLLDAKTQADLQADRKRIGY